MPDGALFALAASDQLRTPAILQQQVERMLADAKGGRFSDSFAGQWLGLRSLAAHGVEPTAFPAFDEDLRAAFEQEQLLYFQEFLTGGLSMQAFLTTRENFVNARLARHYGFPAVPEAAGFQKVLNGDPNRVGFLGLGGFLTETSFSYRTSPTLRGHWILEDLLCRTLPSPPASVPQLGTPVPTNPSPPNDDIRARLAFHARAADCAACHSILDPLGLSLEHFDGIGAYRATYADGAPIDASGMLPTGERFDSVAQLAAVLSSGDHLQALTDCASHKVMTYALSRALTDAARTCAKNGPSASVRATQGYGLEALLEDVVVSAPFRFRRGER